MKIGIFDSGRGGEIVAARIAAVHPEYEYVVINDRAHIPYGNKSAEEILALTEQALQPLINECPVIILACNTATAAAIDQLRSRHPSVVFIGFEPMLKPLGSYTNSGTVTVLATEATRRSPRYQDLKTRYANSLQAIEPATDDWAVLIENGHAQSVDLTATLASVNEGSDVIALACTHYLVLEEKLRQLVPAHVHVIEPTPAVIKQLERLVTQLQAAH